MPGQFQVVLEGCGRRWTLARSFLSVVVSYGSTPKRGEIYWRVAGILVVSETETRTVLVGAVFQAVMGIFHEVFRDPPYGETLYDTVRLFSACLLLERCEEGPAAWKCLVPSLSESRKLHNMNWMRLGEEKFQQ